MPQKISNSILDTIGNTPLVELARLTKNIEGRIFAKIETFNPGLSKKDRMALCIIEEAEASSALLPGQPVVELTSGNAGTGLAIVCAVKGYPFIAVMSKGNSRERARMMAALGAEVILVPQAAGSVPGQVSGEDLALVETKARNITKSRNAFRADQFKLKGNANAHFHCTGPEIIEQTAGRLHAFCDFVGSGGTFGGTAAALKHHNPGIKCYIVEPEGAAVLAGKTAHNSNHRIQGGGYSMPELTHIDPIHVDGYLQVSDSEAIHYARRLASEEGIFGGFSSGANVAAAIHLLEGPCKGQTVVTLVNDSGLKYLSTDLWEEPPGT